MIVRPRRRWNLLNGSGLKKTATNVSRVSYGIAPTSNWAAPGGGVCLSLMIRLLLGLGLLVAGCATPRRSIHYVVQEVRFWSCNEAGIWRRGLPHYIEIIGEIPTEEECQMHELCDASPRGEE